MKNMHREDSIMHREAIFKFDTLLTNLISKLSFYLIFGWKMFFWFPVEDLTNIANVSYVRINIMLIICVNEQC